MEKKAPSDPEDPPIKVIKREILTSSDVLEMLNIIDWHRGGVYWENPLRAFEHISTLLVNRIEYAVLEVHMELAPERDDWPSWYHTGHHVTLAKAWWNWFHWKRKGELILSDSPDFSGTMQLPNQSPIRFWGDFGTVSALAFFESLQQMHAGDLWISIPDRETQVLLAARIDFQKLLDWSNLKLF